MKASPERLDWTRKRVVELVDGLTREDAFGASAIELLARANENEGGDRPPEWFNYMDATEDIYELATLARELATGEVEI